MVKLIHIFGKFDGTGLGHKRTELASIFIIPRFPFVICPFKLGIRASEWTNHKWKMEYCKNASRLRAFVPWTGARPVGMGLPRATWVKLNRQRTGVGRFHSSIHKWGLAFSPNCECGASEPIADHVVTACLIHRAPHGARDLTVWNDETRCWLNNITGSI